MMFQNFEFLTFLFENDFLKNYFTDLSNLLLFSDNFFSPFFNFYYEIIVGFILISKSFVIYLLKHFDLWWAVVWVFLFILHSSFFHPYADDDDLDFETDSFDDYELDPYLIFSPEEEFSTIEPENRSEAGFIVFDKDSDFWIREEVIYYNWLIFEYLEWHEYDFWDDESFTLLEQNYMSSFLGEEWVNFQKNISLLDDIDLRELALSENLSNAEYLEYYQNKI